MKSQLITKVIRIHPLGNMSIQNFLTIHSIDVEICVWTRQDPVLSSLETLLQGASVILACCLRCRRFRLTTADIDNSLQRH